MSVELGRRVVAGSDDVVLLFEPARYPVAYFPLRDIAEGALHPTDRRTTHPDLGETRWLDVAGDDGRDAPPAAWQHVDPPPQADALRDTVASAWRATDAFYEEDKRIVGHAADPYHRIAVRGSSRASYYDVGDVRSAAWSYRAPIEEVTRIADLVSFDPEKVTVTFDGEKLEPVPGQEVVARGPDRNLSVDELDGIQLVERPISATRRA